MGGAVCLKFKRKIVLRRTPIVHFMFKIGLESEDSLIIFVIFKVFQFPHSESQRQLTKGVTRAYRVELQRLREILVYILGLGWVRTLSVLSRHVLKEVSCFF